MTISSGPKPVANVEEYEQLGARHRRVYRMLAESSFIGMILLMATWAITEYINKNGWPDGITLTNGGPHVWNLWIIYPIIVWVTLIVMHRGFTHLTKKVKPEEIDRVRHAIQ